MHGGDIVAQVLKAHRVQFLFTLCGGHISPILSGAKAAGIGVIDVRHEATAVFAADAVARLTGIPGVAAVTAGPGATNTITAIKNAQLAQSPLVLIVGAAATALKGRGALQDIDQQALLQPHVKWYKSVGQVRELAPALQRAFQLASKGIPGPVAVECPVDLLYQESLVREWYGLKSTKGKSLGDRALRLYLNRHVNQLFAGADLPQPVEPLPIPEPAVDRSRVERAAEILGRAKRPVLLAGSQAMLNVREAHMVAVAVEQLGIPVYLSGMARGLLGKNHRLQMRHRRRQALREADVVVLAGVPCDFRLDYGQHINVHSRLISANRSLQEMKKNRRPNLAVLADPGRFLQMLAQAFPGDKSWGDWLGKLRQRDEEREDEIAHQSQLETDLINPVQLCREIAQHLDANSLLVADGGDFVATASYIVSPPGPLTWLDPGVFGTLGVGAGFALGAKLCRPDREVWILYGDGAAGYGLTEFDTFVRHRIPVIAVIGNDACWTQIAREQVEILKDGVATDLRYTDYHLVAEGFGATALLVKTGNQIAETLEQAKKEAAGGQPVLVNAHIGQTDFRKGSISM